MSLAAALLASVACFAQDAQTPPPSTPAVRTVTIPAGTRLPVVLTYPVSTQTTHPGDNFHVQLTVPVTVDDQVVIPPGTFIQGTVDRLSRKGDRAVVRLRSAQLIFPGNYVAPIGPSNLIGTEGTAWLNPSGSTKAGMILAPLAGAGIGAGIGAALHTTQSSTLGGQTITTNTLKGVGIGSVVGMAAGAAVSFALLIHSHQFIVEEGAPMEMTLEKPLILPIDDLNASRWESEDRPSENPPPLPPPSPRPRPAAPVNAAPGSHGICYTPGTPGTPATTIPGPPGPNGVPGAPTIIPGTPAIPGTAYPCP